MKITKKIVIGDLLKDHPETAEVLFEHGLHCIGCMAGQFESLEDGCKAHGFSDKDIDKIVVDLKKKIKEKKS